MTVDEQRADASAAAIARHVTSIRRQRWWYAGIVGVIVMATAAWVAIVWSHSEIVHAHLHSAKSAPADIPGQQLSATPQLSWRTDEQTASGSPFQGGTVVTFGSHTVNGRDARTGVVRWSYTRTDRTICDVVQVQNRTVAFFRHNGNCDEVNAFRTDTGTRVWDRTLDTEGHPVDGDPTIIPRDDAVFVSTDTVVYSIRLNEGFDFWEYAAPTGCRTTGITVGSAGALIAQHCADGNHLVLRDRYAGNDDKDHPVKWRLDKVTALPFAADAFVGAVDPATRHLVRYDPANGHVTGHTALTPTPPAEGTIQQSAAKDGELAWIGGTTYATDPTGSRQLWATATSTLPTVSSSVPTLDLPSLSSAVLLVSAPRGVELLGAADGRVTQTLPVSPSPVGRRVFPVGTGFVVAGPSTIVYK